MKVYMVIPSYWGRQSAVGWREGDAVYDHPTPLDEEGTLVRAIQSLSILENKNFELIVIAAAVAPDIQEEVEDKVAGLLESIRVDVKTIFFSHSHLAGIHNVLKTEGQDDFNDLLQLRGYSNIRNLCLFFPHILGGEAAVLIDDDEVFEDPHFMNKAGEFIGREFEGRPISAVAGYYLQPDGGYHVERTFKPWMRYWDKFDRLNEGHRAVIGTEPRLKRTPFVFGGNMVVHESLFKVIPFDPMVPRGEDIDYLLNARMFGFEFFLDNRLAIKHLPPPKPHPTWKGLREDIFRFVYERAKIRTQKEMTGMTLVRPEEFDPYPGCFLKSDLEEKISRSCQLLALEYLSQGESENAREALNNISLALTEAVPEFDPFLELLNLQKRWRKMMEFAGSEEIRGKLAGVLAGQ
jgi:hypothetical protein